MIKSCVVCIGIIITLFQLIGCGGGSSTPAPPPPVILGQITINITGLPADIDAEVVLIHFKDPISTVWNVTETKTFTNLQPGTYNVGTEAFTKGLVEFISNIGKGVTFDLSEGEKKVINVDYSLRNIIPGTIIFSIDQTDVSSTITVQDITIEGPEDFSFVFNQDSTLIGLIPGGYRVLAPDFIDNNQGYGFVLDKGSFLVEEGGVENNSAKIRSVQARVKSVIDKPIQLNIGIQDNQGNTYTVQNVPNGINFGVSTNTLHKWDSSGNSLWSMIIPDQTYLLWSWELTIDINNNIFLVGYENRGNFTGVQIRDLPSKIYKYDSSGNQLWNKKLDNLSGGDLATVDAVAVQDNKITIFSTKRPAVGNTRLPREAFRIIVDSTTGNTLDTFKDTNINFFRQLKSIQNMGYWILASDRIIHYSADGNEIESINVSFVESLFRDLTGGVVFQPDPLGGIYVMTTIDGPTDSDIQLIRYSSNLTVEWVKNLTNVGKQFPIGISLSNSSDRILTHFGTEENFNGIPGNRVYIEWDTTGAQNWLRQFFLFGGLNVSMESITSTNDWLIKTNSENGGGHYGKGNVIIIGP